ncbi:unnamed protein product [Brassicogethes aeneus]|uniref:Uncharacterized protein n=1 Tax=Brassicogethes aeneus TaxID=1431903 RepID=A0A9P0B7S6_BRAAE|nr:unnamed protein product [Brassicogethes aeneus]
MFSKSSIPQRKAFSMTKEKFIEDINALSTSEEERNKLYYCLDEKPPQEAKFGKLEDFLRGSNDLEVVSEDLETLLKEVNKLSKEVKGTLQSIKDESNMILS